MSLSELLKSPEQEEAEEGPERRIFKNLYRSTSEDSVHIVIPVIEEELGSEISRSITVVGKSVTHRGTQTVIHCKFDESKENFFDMILNTRV